MTWDLRQEECESVLSLPPDKRYAYLLKRVANWGEVWGLYLSNGWVIAGDDAGRELFPIWPHPTYATACATGVWAGAEPRPIEVHDFRDKWIPGLLHDNRL